MLATNRSRTSLLVALTALALSPRVAHADPPPPKVCVAVAGDADSATRSSAATLEQAVASRSELRAVADDSARAALRGEPGSESSQPQLAEARRGLDGSDADARGLDGIGDRLGCALVVEISARPASTMLRAYDVVHHSFRERMSVGTVDASLIDRFVLEPARRSLDVAPPPAAVAAAPATPTAPSTPPRRLSPAPAHPTTAQDTRATVARNATPPRPNAAHHPTGAPAWVPWLIVGAAAAALATVVIVTQNTGPSIPTIHVVHPPMASGASP